MKQVRTDIIQFSRLCLLLCGALLLWGCEQKSIPEPPLDQNRLLLDALQNIKAQHHDIALARLQKLKLIYPDNVALAALIDTEFDNIFIHKVQCSLANGNLDAALQIIQRGLKMRPLDPQLIATKEKLRQLQQVKSSFDNLAQQNNAKALQSAIKQAAALLKKHPELKDYRKILQTYRKLAQLMEKDELNNARLDLAADLKTVKQISPKNRALIGTMQAELEIEKRQAHQ